MLKYATAGHKFVRYIDLPILRSHDVRAGAQLFVVCETESHRRLLYASTDRTMQTAASNTRLRLRPADLKQCLARLTVRPFHGPTTTQRAAGVYSR